VYVVTEYGRDPTDLYNADLFRGCRDAEDDVDAIARSVVDRLDGEVSIQALVDEVNRGPRGFRAIVRLISSRRLKMKRKEKITFSTIVYHAEQTDA